MQSHGDEGMWLFSNPPRQLLKDRYQIELSDAWLEHLQFASVRLNNGGSGSFVSSRGLLLTNHHVGADSLQKLSPAGKDFYLDGFTAKSAAEELKCPDLEVNVLQTIIDVTGQVNNAVKPGMDAAQANAARRAAMSEIEKDSLEKTGLRSDIVTLYQGGLYHLYRYRKYTDVRLVFAPEHSIASFGGDVDNFEFPRFNLDICFFRVYENDKPLECKHFLKWSEAGPKEGEVVFVSGHPGTTQRLESYERLRFRRDVILPYTLSRLRNREANLIQFSAKSPDHAKWAQKDFYSTANSRKAFSGQYQGLLDSSIMMNKKEQEQKLLDALASQGKAELNQKTHEALLQISKCQEALRAIYLEMSLLETADAFDSTLYKIARDLVRLSEEQNKPNGERLREYRISAKSSLELQLFSPAPIHPELEQAKLTASLTFLAEKLGGEHPVTVKILQGKSPAQRAADLIQGTTLADVVNRKKLAENKEALSSSSDSMIQLARLVDAQARSLRKKFEEMVEEPERQAYAALANAKFAVYGTDIAPDATFTLRLAFGIVKGYHVDGRTLRYHTDIAGVYHRHEQNRGIPPFDLPKRWIEGATKLNRDTAFNFVSTADTIGGNSGSPVVNRKGEFVGINFDRNRHGLVRNFVYTEEQARHIAVHSEVIKEALKKLYDVEPLLREIGIN